MGRNSSLWEVNVIKNQKSANHLGQKKQLNTMHGILEQFQALWKNRQGKSRKEENPQATYFASRLPGQVKDEKGQEKSNPKAIISGCFALKE